jgi:hypothetical protein
MTQAQIHMRCESLPNPFPYIVAVLFTILLVVFCQSCSKKYSKNPVDIEKARIAKIVEELSTLRKGDFVELQDGRILARSESPADDVFICFAQPYCAPEQYGIGPLAKQVKRIIPFNHSDWPSYAKRYLLPHTTRISGRLA